MTIAVERPAGCLAPVLVEGMLEDPESVRDMARANGPYFMPARYLVGSFAADGAGAEEQAEPVEVPSYLIGPVWRGDWATAGNALVDGAEQLLHHQPFIDAAQQMCDAEVVVPEQVYVNLNTPAGGSGFSHVDIPEFVGMDRTNTPGWLLVAMGGSRQFEDARITTVTAVAWFYRGERGFFRYWPEGRDNASIRHEAMWNTAVVGDNDFMHHQVERVGPRELRPPEGMTIDTTLEFDGEQWSVMEDGKQLARYTDEHVRLSLSWKAKVYANPEVQAAAKRGDDGLTLDVTLEQLANALGEPLAATGSAALESPDVRRQLAEAFSEYRAE